MKTKFKFNAFTLIEMMITLTIFSITLAVIYNLMGVSVGLLERLSFKQKSQTEILLFSKILEKILRSSHNIEKINGNFYVINDIDNNIYEVIQTNKKFIINEIKENNVISKKIFNLTDINEIKTEILGEEKRKILHLYIKYNIHEIDKYIVLGYKK